MYSYRTLNLFGLLVCIASLLFAVFYLERVLYLDPCPLCILDRVVLVALGLVFAIALAHNPGPAFSRVYGLLASALSLTGVGLAARHIWLQALPADEVPACGPDLYFMLETLPVLDTIRNILMGSGSCAEIQWTLAGLTLPQQTLLLFAGLLALSVILTLKPRKSYQ